jgi:hypothetical protein
MNKINKISNRNQYRSIDIDEMICDEKWNVRRDDVFDDKRNEEYSKVST